MPFDENQWKNHVFQIFDNAFDAKKAHLEMSPYRKLWDSIDSQSAIKCAVGIHVFFDKEPKIVLIERPSIMRKHAGQIAFPGGKMDEIDLDLVHTAMRESEEELGINPQSTQHIGSLSPVFIPVTNYVVYPFVFIHEKKPSFVANELEVHTILFLSFSTLLNPSFQTSKDISVENGEVLSHVPCFEFENKTIWGATSLMLNELRERIKIFLLPTV